jgi:DNA-binding SARP family transcriptional activator
MLCYSLPVIKLGTLGGFTFHVDGIPSPGPHTQKARALMACLAMNHGVDLARERLVEMFWPDADSERARDSLKTALCSIRQSLRAARVDPDEYLRASRSVARWTVACVDILEFEALALSDNIADAHQAMRLYRGDFLEGDYGNWAIAHRERLASLYESVLARVIKTSRDPSVAQRFITRNPYHEEAYATMIEAALAEQQRSSALSWVQRCRHALAEIGEQPSVAFEMRFGSIDAFARCTLQLVPAS